MSSKRSISNWKKITTGTLFSAALVVGVVAGSSGIAAAHGVGNGRGNASFSSTSGSSTSGPAVKGHAKSPSKTSDPGQHPTGGVWGFWHGPSVKGTVASTPAPSSTGFTLDIPGCSTPEAFTTTSSTDFFAQGTGVAQSAVTAGERVIVTLVPGSSTLTAKWVDILLTEVSGAISSIGTMSFVVTDGQGFDHTINVSGPTHYTPSGTTFGTLKVGNGINAFGLIDADHVSLDASVVRVRPATPLESFEAALHHGRGHLVVGVVAASPAPSSTGFTVDEHGSTTEAITTTSSTKYYETGATTPPTGVASGEHVAVSLVGGASTPTASKVGIFLNQLDGTVVSVDTTTMSLVIADHQGFWRTIKVTGSTMYAPSGTTLGTLATGQHVAAFGSLDADTVSLDAQFVDVLTYPAASSTIQKAWNTAASTCPAALTEPTSNAFSPNVTTPPPFTPKTTSSSHQIVAGTVQSVDTTTNLIVVALRNGAMTTVLVTPTTTYRDGTTPDSNLETVAHSVGSQITALGTAGPGTEVTATQVLLGGSGTGPSWPQGFGGSGPRVPSNTAPARPAGSTNFSPHGPGGSAGGGATGPGGRH